MAGNRKAAQNYLIEWIERILPNGGNKAIYQAMFDRMSDDDFDEFITRLEQGEERPSITVPNLKDVKLSFERNLEVADALGHNFFERICIDEGNDIPPYMSNDAYLIVDLPVRRQAQLHEKKVSIPEDNKSVDDLTGQTTKGSKISYPEVQILAALDLKENLKELMKARGGDTVLFNAMNTSIARTGGVSLNAVDTGNTETTANVTLRTLLTCMHLKSTN